MRRVGGETSEMDQLAMIAEAVAERRIAERLARAGLSISVASLSALAQPVAGQLYLLLAEPATDMSLHQAVAAGAHVCVMPPWPPSPLMLGGQPVVPSPAVHRAPVQPLPPLSEAFDVVEGQHPPLRILYREQFASLAAHQSLAVSDAGEVVMAALPRMSNLHGLRIVTTLLLGQPSAQTDVRDAAALLRALQRWATAAVGDQPSASRSLEISAPVAAESEREAQLALLALAMALPKLRQSGARDADLTVALSAVRQMFARIAATLSADLDAGAFATGWARLHSLGIVTTDAGGSTQEDSNLIAQVSGAKALAYIQLWQLSARMRRLAASIEVIPERS